jgi:hypothetical protein
LCAATNAAAGTLLTLGKGAGTNFSLLVLFRFLDSWAASSFFWYSGQMALLAVSSPSQLTHFGLILLPSWQSRVRWSPTHFTHFAREWQLAVACPHFWHRWHCTKMLLFIRMSLPSYSSAEEKLSIFQFVQCVVFVCDD